MLHYVPFLSDCNLSFIGNMESWPYVRVNYEVPKKVFYEVLYAHNTIDKAS